MWRRAAGALPKPNERQPGGPALVSPGPAARPPWVVASSPTTAVRSGVPLRSTPTSAQHGRAVSPEIWATRSGGRARRGRPTHPPHHGGPGRRESLAVLGRDSRTPQGRSEGRSDEPGDLCRIPEPQGAREC
jgi:hypothetical protein